MWIPSKINEIDESQLQEYFGLKKEKLERLREAAKNAISSSQEKFLLKQGAKKPAQKFAIGQLVLVKQHRASKWAPRYDGPFIITKVISENTVEVKRSNSEQKDSVHIDYIKPYYSRDGSPAIGRDAQFPEETDERSDNINYDTRILFDEPAEDFIVETETSIQAKNKTRTTSPQQQGFSPRVSRSMSRLMQTSANSNDDDVDQQNPTPPARVRTKTKSALSRVRDTLKKALPKQVSFRASGSRQHFPVLDKVVVDTTSAQSNDTRAATSRSNSSQQLSEPQYQARQAQAQSVRRSTSSQTHLNSNSSNAHSGLDDSNLPNTLSSVQRFNPEYTTVHEVTPVSIPQIQNKFTTKRRRV
jgi:hypothetical protein